MQDYVGPFVHTQFNSVLRALQINIAGFLSFLELCQLCKERYSRISPQSYKGSGYSIIKCKYFNLIVTSFHGRNDTYKHVCEGIRVCYTNNRAGLCVRVCVQCVKCYSCSVTARVTVRVTARATAVTARTTPVTARV